MKLSEKIYALRTEKGLSQGDLAEKLEVSRQSVSKWETGQAVPDLDKIIKIADLFGVTTDYLLRENETQAPQPEPQVIYLEKPKEEPTEKKELSTSCIISAVLFGTLALTLLAFIDGGSIEDEIGICLAVASVVFAIELLVFRYHPWATVWWTLVGFLPFIIIYTVWWRIDRSIQALMIVIGLTAAAFGLFLTYRKKP